MANGGFLNVRHLLLPVESILNMLIFFMDFRNTKSGSNHGFSPKGFYGIPPLPGVLWVGSQGRQFDHRFKSRGDIGGRSKPLGTPVGSQLFHGTMVVNNPLIRPYCLGGVA